MSMTLRERLEKVLKKYVARWSCECYPEHQDGECQTMGENKRRVIDDLLACFPQPSKKECLNILKRWIPKGLIAHSGPIPIVKSEFIDALMAWATSHTERRWCSHLVNIDGRWVYAQGDGMKGDTVQHGDRLRFCPLCAAPRPQEP